MRAVTPEARVVREENHVTRSPVVRAAASGVLLTAASALAMGGTAAAASAQSIVVQKGQTLTVSKTERFDGTLTVEPGGSLVAPTGDSLTMTVNGVETGQRVLSTGGTYTVFKPGTYSGEIVLDVTAENTVPWQGLNFDLRQALFVGGSGVVRDESVASAVQGGAIAGRTANGVSVHSTGQAFDGAYVENGRFRIDHSSFTLDGNGRSDFIGDGAAIVADGTKAHLVVNDTTIDNTGAVRTGVVVENGAHSLVKNSTIATHDGTLPKDYQPTVNLATMESVPWMLSIHGDVRATNVLGTDSYASYVNDSVSSTGWGLLSSDSGMDNHISAVDDDLTTTGSRGGYGTYAIGNATETLLGDDLNVGTYATINRGGTVTYGDSGHHAVTELNAAGQMGLGRAEIAALPVRPSVIHSKRFGFMWHGAGTLALDGHTVVDSKEATLLDKGQQIGVTVHRDVTLDPGSGILEQVIDNDDPGPVVIDGNLVNQGVYTQPATPTKDSAFDTGVAHSTDAFTTFEGTTVTGDLYNGFGGGASDFYGTPGLNMVLRFRGGASLTGAISSTLAVHTVSPISSKNWSDLGEVTNTPEAAVNNGALVSLTGHSHWTATGTSYLTRLRVDAGSTITAPSGKSLTVTVDGTPVSLRTGHTYTGDIELRVS